MSLENLLPNSDLTNMFLTKESLAGLSKKFQKKYQLLIVKIIVKTKIC